MKLDVKDQYEVSERGIVARDIDPDVQVRNATRNAIVESEAKNFVDMVYNENTVKGLDPFVVESNRSWIVDQLKKGYFSSVASAIAKHTGVSENEAWNKLSTLLLKTDGIAKYDGKTFANVTEMSVESLRKALELGGLPAPSIGIVDVDNPRTNFGNVTFIFPNYRFSPENDPTFNGDAYTESFPAVANFTTSDFSEQIIEDFDGVITEDKAYELSSYLDNLSYIQEGQRTSHDIYTISYQDVKHMVNDWRFNSISILHDLYKSRTDEYGSYSEFLDAFVKKYFTHQRVFRGDTLPDWLSLDSMVSFDDSFNRQRFKSMDIDNVVEIMTSNERKSFSDVEQIKTSEELESNANRARVRGLEKFYEIKPQRAVWFDDASYVVVPSSAPKEIFDSLDAWGINVVTYDGKDQTESVKGILEDDKHGDIRYSKRITTRTPANQLTMAEWAEVKSRISAIRKLGHKVQRSHNGQYIISINNKLVYTDASFRSPGISNVIELGYMDTTLNEDEIDFARFLIYGAEENGQDAYTVYQAIENGYGREYVMEYRHPSYGMVYGYDRPTKRNRVRSDSYHARWKQNQRERLDQISEEIRKLAESEDGETRNSTRDNKGNRIYTQSDIDKLTTKYMGMLIAERAKNDANLAAVEAEAKAKIAKMKFASADELKTAKAEMREKILVEVVLVLCMIAS